MFSLFVNGFFLSNNIPRKNPKLIKVIIFIQFQKFNIKLIGG